MTAGKHARPSLPARPPTADAAFVAAVDRRLAAGVARAGGHVVCRPGCTACCIGVFEVTLLDAARLGAGLAALGSVRRERVRSRAAAQWAALRGSFPGTAADGILGRDEAARLEFYERFSDAACPALDPEAGTCDLYAHRPLACRTYGLPIQAGAEVLAACPLNFEAASPSELAAATVDPDPDDEERPLLHEVGDEDTLVCVALLGG